MPRHPTVRGYEKPHIYFKHGELRVRTVDDRGTLTWHVLDPRTEHMMQLYKSGKTLREIGEVYGITREGVRQLLKPWGITRKYGGKAIRYRKVVTEKRNRVNQNILARWGITSDEYQKIRAKYGPHASSGSPFRLFIEQRRNFRCRTNVPWTLKFVDWWRCWQESGKWKERGRGRYVLARIVPTEGFHAGNIRVVLMGELAAEKFEDGWLPQKGKKSVWEYPKKKKK